MLHKLLTLLAFAGLVGLIPSVFASESFHGSSSFENAPSELTPGESAKFEIKLRYTEGPYAISNLSSLIVVSPASAAPMVLVEAQPLEGITQGQVVRIPVTLTLNPNIEHEKIFLSVSFSGNHFSSRSDAFYKSSWTDSISFDVAPKDQIHIPADYEIIPWGQLEVKNDAAKFTKNMIPQSIVNAGEPFFVVQKMDFTDDNFAANSTFDAIIGYAFTKGDRTISPPKGENVTREELEEFGHFIQQQHTRFYQSSDFEKSFEFTVNSEEPFLVKSSFVLPEPGKYTHQFYKKLKNSPATTGSNIGGTIVVEKFSKAMNDGGICNNNNHRILIKYDYSMVSCVTKDTALKLIERGWANHKSKPIDYASLFEKYAILPEVVAFYEKYPQAIQDIRSDHISYAIEKNDGYKVRMKIFFDENYRQNYIDFHCYKDRILQHEVAQEDIVHYLKNKECGN